MLFEWQLFAVGFYSWEGVRVKTLLALGQKCCRGLAKTLKTLVTGRKYLSTVRSDFGRPNLHLLSLLMLVLDIHF